MEEVSKTLVINSSQMNDTEEQDSQGDFRSQTTNMLKKVTFASTMTPRSANMCIVNSTERSGPSGSYDSGVSSLSSLPFDTQTTQTQKTDLTDLVECPTNTTNVSEVVTGISVMGLITTPKVLKTPKRLQMHSGHKSHKDSSGTDPIYRYLHDTVLRLKEQVKTLKGDLHAQKAKAARQTTLAKYGIRAQKKSLGGISPKLMKPCDQQIRDTFMVPIVIEKRRKMDIPSSPTKSRQQSKKKAQELPDIGDSEFPVMFL